jgi:hypothetical protein
MRELLMKPQQEGGEPDSELNDLPVEPRQESLRCFFVLKSPRGEFAAGGRGLAARVNCAG